MLLASFVLCLYVCSVIVQSSYAPGNVTSHINRSGKGGGHVQGMAWVK